MRKRPDVSKSGRSKRFPLYHSPPYVQDLKKIATPTAEQGI